MRWEQFIVLGIFLAVFSVITMTVLFYLRHWASRTHGNNVVTLVEGEYFKRYIPEQLRDRYVNNPHVIRAVPGGRKRLVWAKGVSILTVFSAIAVTFYSVVLNRYTFLLPIELEPQEIDRLDFTQHQWRRNIDHQLPELSKALAGVKQRGFVIPYHSRDNHWNLHGVNQREIALKHWQNFSRKNHFDTAHCQWNALMKCQIDYPDWIILVLPGFWDRGKLDDVLEKGANVIAYGPPAQLFENPGNAVGPWHGLMFETAFKREPGDIILLGDQVLTLGFDAGLVVKTLSPFRGYMAFAENPQAVAIGDLYEAGGENETRLYAATVGKGRLVWLDFSPDIINHNPRTNMRHLDAIMGAIFRYFSRRPYSALAMWPQARGFAALIEEDTEDQFDNAATVQNLVRDNSYPITWYILSNQALKHRSLTKSLSETGEIACHGDHHGLFTKSDRRDQVVRIARCQKVLAALTGAKPLAFRPPEEEFNSATVDAIVNNGMTHYIAENSPDRSVPEIQVSLVNGKSLVSIPRVVSDDYELWHTRNLGRKETLQVIDDETEWMSQIGGLYMFSFHTQYMNNLDNLAAVAHVGNRLNRLSAYFATSKDIADWWRFRTALQQGEKGTAAQFVRFSPVRLTVNALGILETEPVYKHDGSDD